MTIVVTGAAGFIGSNLIKGLNKRGITEIIAVDDLTDGDKFINLSDLQITDYVDHQDFYELFAAGAYGHVEAVFHEGACSDTMETDGRYMMENNFTTTSHLQKSCALQNTRLIYASSAATYGGSSVFKETPEFELPLNVYGYSKLLFDQRMRALFGNHFERSAHQIVGFRYFNVYGPREQHKGRMASVAYHQHNQFKEHGRVRLFGHYAGYAAGEQMRDFVYIDDVVEVNLWFLDHPEKSGLFNLGSGRAQPFNDVALSVINAELAHQNTHKHTKLSLIQAVHKGMIEYIDFPQALVGKYQCYTQADLSALRAAGCAHNFKTVEQGVSAYMNTLNSVDSVDSVK
jgi:ADP-L-glycero-D-manno-heptose 6-epimerase